MICENCNRELKRNWEYCPYCGEQAQDSDSLLDNLFYNDIFNDMDKELKQINKLFSKSSSLNIKPRSFTTTNGAHGGISISISSMNGSQPKINVKKFGDFADREEARPEKKISLKEKLLKKFQRTNKISDKIEQPSSTIKRLADKLIYELNTPGVSSLKDIEINKLENSTEIKAFAKDKTYLKVIPIDLEMKKHALKDGKLILEFGLD